MNDAPDYMKALVSLVGRQTFPPAALAEIVGVGKVRQIEAYNLCNGLLSQTEIQKKMDLDSGNFSRTVSRWLEQGIVFRIGDGSEARLLHLYPIPDSFKKEAKK